MFVVGTDIQSTTLLPSVRVGEDTPLVNVGKSHRESTTENTIHKKLGMLLVGRGEGQWRRNLNFRNCDTASRSRSARFFKQVKKWVQSVCVVGVHLGCGTLHRTERGLSAVSIVSYRTHCEGFVETRVAVVNRHNVCPSIREAQQSLALLVLSVKSLHQPSVWNSVKCKDST